MLSLFDLTATLIALTAVLAWLNQRVLRLPANIGLLVMGLIASFVVIGVDAAVPAFHFTEALRTILRQIDFTATLMNGMLAFLLFAGALTVDLAALGRRAVVVGTLATIGVVLSTGLITFGMWGVSLAAGAAISLPWLFVFGALIAPTDPVAVQSAAATMPLPPRLAIDMPGEALFNDGIAVVLFTTAVQVALGSHSATGGSVLWLMVVQAGGGLLLGFATGTLAVIALRGIDEFSTEVLISLALVTTTYSIAGALHVSGPIAVVVAGLLLGNPGADHAMSDRTKRYMFGFWRLVEDILNAALFLLIGLEVLVVQVDARHFLVAVCAIAIVLAARLISVAAPVLLLRLRVHFDRGTIAILTWGGVRGGISIALVLSLPDVPERATLIAATYAVVLFTIIVQGLTLARVLDVVRQTGDDEGGAKAGR